jgi:hypothetical protein
MGCPKCYTLFAGNHGTSQLLNIGNYVSNIFIVYIYMIYIYYIIYIYIIILCMYIYIIL